MSDSEEECDNETDVSEYRYGSELCTFGAGSKHRLGAFHPCCHCNVDRPCIASRSVTLAHTLSHALPLHLVLYLTLCHSSHSLSHALSLYLILYLPHCHSISPPLAQHTRTTVSQPPSTALPTPVAASRKPAAVARQCNGSFRDPMMLLLLLLM